MIRASGGFGLAFGCWMICVCSLAVAWQTEGENLARIDGFVVDKMFDIPKQQGSWVSMTVDDKGRLIASDQYGGLYRVTLDDAAQTTRVEPIEIKTGRAHGLLYAFGGLYVMSHEGDGQPSGLYKAEDTDNDDQYDSVRMLMQVKGGGEHGPHAIILSPDKKSLYICAGNHTELPKPTASRVPLNWDEDQVVPRMWDANGHAAGILAPGGWICQTDPEGKTLELLSMGYRNQYDIAMNTNGELFTFDADMEWDIGLPWYRPTRVCHATAGSEFGWRSGTGKWPAYYPDSLPATIDIGPGSPTGISFGTGAKFPAKYQNALFIADWSYGAIHAVHMKDAGASYSADKEVFVTGPGLAITDMVVNPKDGSLYFLIGGRRTHSALYRVSYRGSDSTAPAATPPLTEMQALRRQLEGLLTAEPSEANQVVKTAVPNLAHVDRFIRYTARIAIERMPSASWGEAILKPRDTQSTLESALAIARSGDDALAAKAIERLLALSWGNLTPDQQLHWLRDVGLLWLRRNAALKDKRDAIASYLQPHFPSGSSTLDMELARLLCGIDAPGAVAPTMRLMQESKSQEEQVHYNFVLRVCTQGWTSDLRQQYYQWFVDAGRFRGGNSFAKFLLNTRADAVTRLSDEEKNALGGLLTAAPINQRPDVEVAKRPIVKNWKLEELLPIKEQDLANRDLKNGEKMFAVGQCFKCHRLDGAGGSVGPDLTPAGRRFNSQDLLETLVVPSKEVSDQYRATVFQLENGQTVVGRVANLNGDQYMVQTDLYDPGRFTNIKVGDIADMKPSTTSMMPTGLLDSMTRDEVLDLVAYLRSVSDAVMKK
ncbi:MAG: L-sorbosone dehydrogenase [Pirellulaceae bacterium]